MCHLKRQAPSSSQIRYSFFLFSSIKTETLYILCVQNNILNPTHLFCNAIREGFSLSYSTILWIEIFVCSIIYFLGTKYWVKPFRKLLELSKEGQAFIAFTSASVSTLVIIITTYFGVYFGDNLFFYLAVSTFLEGIYFLCLIKFYKNTLRIQQLTRENEKIIMLELSVKMTKERLSLLEETTKIIKLERHDRRHINTMLLQMLKEGQIEKVIEYLDHSLESNHTIAKNYCENITVNALISYYAEVCQRNEIKFVTSLDIPEKCVKDDMELCMALSNLLENAVNATKKINDKRRFIQISALYTGQLLIEIKNSSLSDVLFDSNGYPISLRENHGTGIKSVLTYIEKINGEISYQLKENIFYVRINL